MHEKYIVIIDDEVGIRETVSAIIVEFLGYKTMSFTGVDEFMDYFDTNKLKPTIIVSDVHMPTGSGLLINSELMKRDLQIPVIYISSMVDTIPKRDNVYFSKKPLITKEFVTLVENLFMQA